MSDLKGNAARTCAQQLFVFYGLRSISMFNEALKGTELFSGLIFKV